MEVLGIDNVFFEVGNLGEAVAWYQSLGLGLKFQVPDKGMALFTVGSEEPGLVVRVGELPLRQGTLWVEVEDAVAWSEVLPGKPAPFDTATGKTVEIEDPWGNRIGFADYVHRPELARRK